MSVRQQRALWYLAAGSLTLTYLFAHQPAQRGVQALHGAIGADHFAKVFIVLGFGCLLMATGVGLLSIRRRRHDTDFGRTVRPLPFRWILGLWGFTAFVALVSHYFLVAVDSELVHWLQYGALYWLFLGASRRLGQAAVWTVLAGILDEAYQFWVLQAHWNVYLDFNDLVLNAIGALFALSLAASMLRVRYTSWHKRVVATGAATLVASALVLFLAASMAVGVGAFYKSQSPEAWFVLSRSDASQEFWIITEWARRGFHVLSPIAGIGLTLITLISFAAIDGWWTLDSSEQTSPKRRSR